MRSDESQHTAGRNPAPVGWNGARAGRSSPTRALLVLGGLLAAGCVTNPYTGRSQLLLGSSPAQESALGVSASRAILRDPQTRVVRDPRYTEPVRRVSDRIIEAARTSRYADLARTFEWEVFVLDDPEANAFALPGGKIFVNTGIFPIARDEAGLAAILGHEVTHALARHAAERSSQGQLANLGIAVAGAAAGAATNSSEAARTTMSALGAGAKYGVLLPFSRTHESEADYVGLLLAAEAGYDPREAIAMWKRMERVGGAGPAEFASTHPSHDTRISQIEGWLPEAEAIYHSHPPAPNALLPAIKAAAGEGASRAGRRADVTRGSMSTSLAPRLVNGPFGDPGLLVELRWQGSAVLFDLGRNDGLPAADVLRVDHVLVSHTHMDHFIGFDRVLRLSLNREKTLRLFGPAGILDCVAGKLSGYVWNLTDGYPFAYDVVEVRADGFDRAVFRACTGFKREPAPFEPPVPRSGSAAPGGILLVEEKGHRICTAITNHKIPCLAFSIEEPMHLNVDPERLASGGFVPGRWLAELKELLRRGAPDATRVVAATPEHGTREISLGELRELVRVTDGQKVGYVVDTRFLPENLAVLLPLLHRADMLFCESPFLDEDRDQAAMRYHLTAAEAGAIARLSRARRLRVFHYSPRYQGRGELLRQEAEAAFRGRIDPGALAEMTVPDGAVA